jgi:hypothetical protein
MTLLLFLLGIEMKEASGEDCSTPSISLLFDDTASVKTM